VRYRFDWDPAKEAANIRKHKVGFRRAATVFDDPNHIAIYDEDHSGAEDRWVTIGIDSTGVMRVVVHTFKQLTEGPCDIRIISARKATKREARQYRNRGI